MKMAKASERDIDAAGNAMSILGDISGGYYPAGEVGDEVEPTWFDPDNADHLRHFYDLINATLDKSPGWPGRVIGGMCYVILFDKNQIVDPSADTLELHPRFAAAADQRDELLKALKELADAAQARENPMGDPCALLAAQASLRDAAKKAREIITKQQGGV